VRVRPELVDAREQRVVTLDLCAQRANDEVDPTVLELRGAEAEHLQIPAVESKDAFL
jgi:hypothetical protein